MPNHKILVVEDESVVALDICQSLGHLGYGVVGVASSGEEAIRKATQFHPDAVLMDITLKGKMDGIEAAQNINRDLNIPVIFLTAHSNTRTLEQAKLAEPYGYILKPFEDRELGVAIEIGLYKHTKFLEQSQFHTALIEDLRNQALRDSLTGLYNRRYFHEELDREMSRARRSRRPFALAVLDVDHFKRVNDEFGHFAGDAVLRAVGRLLLRLFRAEDIVCRMGGDEMLIAMPETNCRGAEVTANRLRMKVSELRVEHDGQWLGPVTLSIGIAGFPDHGSTAETLLQNADSALYEAKSRGRNQVAVASQS